MRPLLALVPAVFLVACTSSGGSAGGPGASAGASSSGSASGSVESGPPATVQIHYLGHASFVLEFDNGVSVLTDNGVSNAFGLHSPINDLAGEPDVVTFSHDHSDHHRPNASFATRHVLTGTDSLALNGLSITPVRTSEAAIDFADNTSFVFSYRGLKILHVADAQAYVRDSADPAVQARLKAMYPDRYDLVLFTIDGQYAIVSEAAAFLEFLAPARAIPMHYWSAEAKSQFLGALESAPGSTKIRVTTPGGSDYTLTGGTTTAGTEVISLEPSAFQL